MRRQRFRHGTQIHVLRQYEGSCLRAQYLDTVVRASARRQVHLNIKPPSAQQGRVQQVGAIGSTHKEDTVGAAVRDACGGASGVVVQEVELREQLRHHAVQHPAPVAALAPSGRQGVQLIEKENARV